MSIGVVNDAKPKTTTSKAKAEFEIKPWNHEEIKQLITARLKYN